MALLHVLIEVKKHGCLKSIEVAHVNYGLRGAESDGDEAFVRQFCCDYGLILHVKRVVDKVPESGVQEWARDLRLAYFEELLDREMILFLGHQSDDLAESLLMRMSRGSGIGNLLGMRRWHQKVCRPLLQQSRKEIQAYLDRHHIPTREDSSNAKLIYSRNRIRHEVIPVLESLYPGAMERLVTVGREVEEMLDWCREKARPPLLGHNHLDARWLGELPRVLAIDALSHFIKEKCLVDVQLSRGLLYDMYSAAQSPEGSNCWALSGSRNIALSEGAFRLVTTAESPRFKQHERNLLSEIWNAFLIPGAEVSVPFQVPLMVKNCLDRSIELSIESSHEAIMIDSIGNKLSLGDLIERWQLDASVSKLISVDKSSTAIISGDQLLTVGMNFMKIVLEDWLVSIQTQQV